MGLPVSDRVLVLLMVVLLLVCAGLVVSFFLTSQFLVPYLDRTRSPDSIVRRLAHAVLGPPEQPAFPERAPSPPARPEPSAEEPPSLPPAVDPLEVKEAELPPPVPPAVPPEPV